MNTRQSATHVPGILLLVSFSCCCSPTVHASVGKPVKTKSRLGRSRPASQDLPHVDPDLDPSVGNDPLFDPASEVLPVSRPHQSAQRTQGRAASSNLVKRYGALFIWGQLSGWFKQTVYDPTASLSAERRGTLSLPDPDSCYGSGRQYTLKVTWQASACVPRRLIIGSAIVLTVQSQRKPDGFQHLPLCNLHYQRLLMHSCQMQLSRGA